jgi:hypothetical protein
MQIIISAELERKVQALAVLLDKTVDEVASILLSNSIESMLPLQPHWPIPSSRRLDGREGEWERNRLSRRGSLAAQIRDYVVSDFVEPARERGETEIVVKSGDVHRSLDLRNRLPAVCAVLGSDIFRKLAGVEPLGVTGPANGATTEFRFKL